MITQPDTRQAVSRSTRLAPLAGVVSGVLALAAFAASPGAPALGASGASVLAFYARHPTAHRVSDVCWTLAYVALVFFSAQLLTRLQRTGSIDSLARAAQAGVAVLACGATVFFGLDYVIAALPHGIDPAVAQTVNVLAQQLFLPVAAGMLIFGIAIGAAIVTTPAMPSWLGWIAIVVAVLVLSPFAIFAVLGMFVWSLAAGITLMRSEPVAEGSRDS